MPDGSPATGARLFLAAEDRPDVALEEIKLDPTGRFRRSLNYRDRPQVQALTLSAIVPGKATLWRTFAVSDKTLGSLALRLDPAVALTGQVLDVDGKPLSGIEVKVPQLSPDFTTAREEEAERVPFPISEFLPKPLLKTLWQARTDTTGHFTLSNLPHKVQLHLNVGPNVMLTSGSASAITIREQKQVDAGMLVAIAPGGIALHLTDRTTGKPAKDVQIVLLPKVFSAQDFGEVQDDGSRARMRGLVSDEKGNIAMEHLTPGEYRILVEGMERLVTVTASHTEQIELTVRTGPLRGRIVDGAGKPVAGVSLTLDMSSDPLKEAFGGFGLSDGQRATRGIAQTGPDGQFEIAFFPWEATSVTLRGARGNSEAVWSGSGRTIGKRLDLNMRSGALITVKGRLVNPEGNHVKEQTVSLIRWQDAPRITWLINATSVPVDAKGHFKVEGLRRGEGFSLLAGSPFGRTGRPSEEGFESPRFTTSQEAAVQDLGDVVVHPLDNGEQVLQIYGIGSRQQLTQLAALMPPPSAASSDAAREALGRYRAAMASGDFTTVHHLTSPLSSGWSADRREFMAHSALRVPEQQDLQPLRFVPGISLAYLLTLGKPGASSLNFSFGAAAGDLQANPDWIVFARPGEKAVQATCMLHREQGEWKVVVAPTIFGNDLNSLFLLDSSGGGRAPSSAGFRLPAPMPDAAQLNAARTAGEKYLAAWAHGDDSTQLALTSPLSTGAAANLAELRKSRSRRLDEGICPVSDMSALHLTPLEGVTQWESEWLANYAGKFEEISGEQRAPSMARRAQDEAFPAKYVERGDLIPFSYNVDGHEFLILMLKQKDGWQVLEPAMPL